MKLQESITTHAPNRKLKDLPGGKEAFYSRVEREGAAGVQFLHDKTAITHTREDAKDAKDRGLDVMVRAKDEGLGHVINTMAAIEEFGPRKNEAGQVIEGAVAKIIIVGGNEPTPDQYWKWAWHLEEIGKTCGPAAREAGIELCAPALHGTAEPWQRPPKGTDWQDESLPDDVRLAARIYGVLDEYYKAYAIHAYGTVVFDGHLARIARWQEQLPEHTFHLSEAALAAKDLMSKISRPANWHPSELIKAGRTARFAFDVSKLPRSGKFSRYIDSGSTAEWGSFTTMGEYDPKGLNSYHLSDTALASFAQSIRVLG